MASGRNPGRLLPTTEPLGPARAPPGTGMPIADTVGVETIVGNVGCVRSSGLLPFNGGKIQPPSTQGRDGRRGGGVSTAAPALLMVTVGVTLLFILGGIKVKIFSKRPGWSINYLVRYSHPEDRRHKSTDPHYLET